MTTSTRERMVTVTARLLKEKGYHGTSLNEILRESAAPRGSLYFHFPGGKDQLILEATVQTVTVITDGLMRAAARSPSTGDLIREAFINAADALKESDYKFGCPVAPIILDLPDATSELQGVCRDAFDTWLGVLADTLRRDGRSPESAAALSNLVQSAFEGALIIARAKRDDNFVRQMADHLAALVEA